MLLTMKHFVVSQDLYLLVNILAALFHSETWDGYVMRPDAYSDRARRFWGG
jgi:hypothetical protein